MVANLLSLLLQRYWWRHSSFKKLNNFWKQKVIYANLPSKALEKMTNYSWMMTGGWFQWHLHLDQMTLPCNIFLVNSCNPASK